MSGKALFDLVSAGPAPGARPRGVPEGVDGLLGAVAAELLREARDHPRTRQVIAQLLARGLLGGVHGTLTAADPGAAGQVAMLASRMDGTAGRRLWQDGAALPALLLGLLPAGPLRNRSFAACTALIATVLVLMDGSMPGLDGFEAARAIRAREAETGRARLPIVALTAHVVGTAADAWREAGMDDVVHKPFTLSRLGEVLAAFAPGERGQGAPQPIAAAASDEAACLDESVLQDLIAMTNGSIETAQRIAELYRVKSMEEADRLAEATREGDVDRIAACAHALKSMSANLGARRLAGAAAEMERAAREDAVPPGPESLEMVAGLLQRTHREIAEAMARVA